jgi:hypothetical protein
MPGTWVGVDEMRFYGNLIGWKSTLNELVLIEFGKNNISIDLGIPGLKQAMGGNHGCNHGRLETRLSVATMDNSWPREELSQTVATEATLSIKTGCGTKQSGIMKRLNHGDSQSLTGGIGCRRNEHKGIMEMYQVRLYLLQQCP